MEGSKRREKIIELVKRSEEPVSGTALAKEMEVSRQVIVQDIALIRANGVEIVSTNRGYVINSNERPQRIIKSVHDEEQAEEEMFSIVDLGGWVESVIVNHRFYHRIEAPLNIHSRKDVKAYMEAIRTGKSKPLSSATSGYHYHIISADSENTLNQIEEELKNLGFWLPLDDWILN